MVLTLVAGYAASEAVSVLRQAPVSTPGACNPPLRRSRQRRPAPWTPGWGLRGVMEGGSW